jgi:hypothetical protein
MPRLEHLGGCDGRPARSSASARRAAISSLSGSARAELAQQGDRLLLRRLVAGFPGSRQDRERGSIKRRRAGGSLFELQRLVVSRRVPRRRRPRRRARARRPASAGADWGATRSACSKRRSRLRLAEREQA